LSPSQKIHSLQKTESVAVGQHSAESIQKIINVWKIGKNLSAINPPHDDVLQLSMGVYANFSRHVSPESNHSEPINRKSEERPLCLQTRSASLSVLINNLLILQYHPNAGNKLRPSKARKPSRRPGCQISCLAIY
jgi:hypothetical protein